MIGMVTVRIVVVVGMVVVTVTCVVTRHSNVAVAQFVGHTRRTLRHPDVAVPFKRTAHEHVQAMLFRVDNDGQRNVNVSPQVDVVGVRNVVDDEVARVERLLFMAVVVAVVSPCRCGHRGDQQSEEECNTLVHGCKSGAKVLTKAVFCTIEISSFDFGRKSPPSPTPKPRCKPQTPRTPQRRIGSAPPVEKPRRPSAIQGW